MRSGRREDNGRRLTDRQLVSVTAAVDAAEVIAQLEREIAAAKLAWGNCFPAPRAENNGAHIGNFYAMKGIRRNGKV